MSSQSFLLLLGAVLSSSALCSSFKNFVRESAKILKSNDATLCFWGRWIQIWCPKNWKNNPFSPNYWKTHFFEICSGSQKCFIQQKFKKYQIIIFFRCVKVYWFQINYGYGQKVNPFGVEKSFFKTMSKKNFIQIIEEFMFIKLN